MIKYIFSILILFIPFCAQTQDTSKIEVFKPYRFLFKTTYKNIETNVFGRMQGTDGLVYKFRGDKTYKKAGFMCKNIRPMLIQNELSEYHFNEFRKFKKYEFIMGLTGIAAEGAYLYFFFKNLDSHSQYSSKSIYQDVTFNPKNTLPCLLAYWGSFALAAKFTKDGLKHLSLSVANQ